MRATNFLLSSLRPRSSFRAPLRTFSSAGTSAMTPGSAGRLLLIDVMPVLYRSHHALRDRLVNSRGFDTTVLYGVMGNLLALLEAQPTFTHMVAVFDSPGKNFRHELYPQYKETRESAPAPVAESIPYAKDLFRALNVKISEVPGLEADDCIGTLAARGVREGYDVTIASGDKDLEQLLALPGSVRMLKPNRMGGTVPYTVDDFRAKYDGLEPHQWTLALALMGDSTDNIPGVKGIGEKRAIALAKQGELEFLIANASTLTPKAVREVLSTPEGQSSARLSYRLVTVRTDADKDVPLLRFPLSEAALRLPPDQGAEVAAMMEGLEINKHRARMGRALQRLAAAGNY